MAARTTSKGPLRLVQSGTSGYEAALDKLCARRREADESVEKTVRRILDKIRTGGDRELLLHVRKLDSAKVEALEVGRDEWDEACERVDPADRAALGKAAMRVRDFHKRRIPGSWEMREEGGALMGQRVRALHRVGLYAPGGKAAYPSSVIMNAIPASVVEVPEILLATPPGPDGRIRPDVLMAARVAGVHRVFKMGGAQAVAAFAFGTETVPRVDKVVGPGNAYVATAKRLVFGEVGIDSEAGPSEVLIVADRSATPAWLAADLLSQAEHDEEACAVLVTPVKGLVTRVQEAVTRQLKALDRSKIAQQALSRGGAVVLTRTLDEALAVANRYAPEHLMLCVEDTDAALKRVTNAGAIFLGHYSPVALGDYLAGPNHVLPTGGTARFFSPLGVEDFLKRTNFVRFEPAKLRELGADVIRLAGLEGLSGHGESVEQRLAKIRRARREREAARGAALED